VCVRASFVYDMHLFFYTHDTKICYMKSVHAFAYTVSPNLKATYWNQNNVCQINKSAVMICVCVRVCASSGKSDLSVSGVNAKISNMVHFVFAFPL